MKSSSDRLTQEGNLKKMKEVKEVIRIKYSKPQTTAVQSNTAGASPDKFAQTNYDDKFVLSSSNNCATPPNFISTSERAETRHYSTMPRESLNLELRKETLNDTLQHRQESIVDCPMTSCTNNEQIRHYESS